MDFVDHLVRQYGRGRIDVTELQNRLRSVSIDLVVGDPDLCEARIDARLSALLSDLEPAHVDAAFAHSVQLLVSQPVFGPRSAAA